MQNSQNRKFVCCRLCCYCGRLPQIMEMLNPALGFTHYKSVCIFDGNKFFTVMISKQPGVPLYCPSLTLTFLKKTKTKQYQNICSRSNKLCSIVQVSFISYDKCFKKPEYTKGKQYNNTAIIAKDTPQLVGDPMHDKAVRLPYNTSCY